MITSGQQAPAVNSDIQNVSRDETDVYFTHIKTTFARYVLYICTKMIHTHEKKAAMD